MARTAARSSCSYVLRGMTHQCLRQVSLIILFFLSTAIINAQSDSESGEELETVVLQLKWRHQFQFAGYYAAIDQGFYRDAGLNVVIQEGRPGRNFVDMVIDGRADYGVEMPVILLERCKGKPVVAMAAIFQHSPEVLLVSKKSRLRSPQDLVGKTVMLREHGNIETRAMLLSEGVDLDAVEIVPHSWEIKDLINARVDAMSAYITDQPSFLQSRRFEYSMIKPQTYGIDFYGDCLFTSEKEIQEHPERAKAFLKASLRGWRYAMGHIDDITNLLFDEYHCKVSREGLIYEARAMADLMFPGLIQIGHMNEGRWERIAETYVDVGMLEPGYSLEGFLYDPDPPVPPPDYRWIVWTASVCGGGLFLALLGSMILIYFNRRLRRAVHESEVRHRDIVEALPDGLCVGDLDGKILAANAAMSALYGYSSEELIGMAPVDLISPTHHSVFDEFVREIKDTGRFTGESVDKRKDGSTFDTEIRGSMIQFDGKPHLLAIIRDVTERNRAQAERLRLSAAIEQTTESIILSDPNGIIQYVNPAFEEMTGYSRDECIGENILSLSGQSDEKTISQVMQALRQGESWSSRMESMRKDGSFYQEEVAISPVRDASGKVISYVSVQRDITEERKLEDQLRQSQKMEAIGQLAGGVAHDFNNLLQAIQGYTVIATEGLPKDSSARDDLAEATKAIDRASTLARQLLAFSRPETYRPEYLNVNDVIAGLMKIVGRVIGEHIELEVIPGENLSEIHADPGHLEQVLMNLCVNARDAMTQGGRLTIETGNLYVDKEHAEAHPDNRQGSYVTIRVSDTGEGMAPEVLEHIYEPFFTTKEVGQGTGLGLATVYGIVNQHRGTIHVYSEQGRGSSFVICLPAAEEPKPNDAGERPDPPRGGTETILLAEDDKQVRELAVKVLERAGYTVVAARDGGEAVELFERHDGKISLALLDVVMPNGSGQDVAEALRAKSPDLPVLFTSGYSRNYLGADIEPQKNTELIHKPLSPNQLLRKVRQLIDGQYPHTVSD